MKRNLTKSAGAPAKTGRGSIAASPGRRWLAPMAYALALTVASGLSAPFDAQAAAEADRLGFSATAASAVPLIASAASTVAATPRAPEFALPKAAVVPNASAKRIAEDYVLSSHGQHGLVRSDISELQPNESTYVTDHNGVTHVFFDQLVNGIPVYKAHFQVNVLPNGEVLLPTSSFFPNAHAAASVTTPSLSAAQAVELAAADLGETSFRAMPVAEAVQTAFAGGTLSAEDIKPKLVYQPHGNELRLAWQFAVDRHVKEAKYLDLRYDAITGEQLISENYVNELGASHDHAADKPVRPQAATHNEVYRVFPFNYESPTHTGNPMAGHVLVTNPYDVPVAPSGVLASPYGWHDTTTTPTGTAPQYTRTQGNNVRAQWDLTGNNPNISNSNSPQGTYNAGTNTLTLDFPWDENQAPDSASNRIAATVNLFYWNNIIHDVMYNYGFNEVAGNFQVNNYGRCTGCTGNHQNDGVVADALDGSQAATPSVNNANFSTPADGSAPRMQMFRWTAPAALRVLSPYQAEYNALPAGWGGTGYSSGYTNQIVLANDGSANPSEGCGTTWANAAEVAGKVALVIRGTCEFGSKAKRAQQNGAAAVVIYNNAINGDEPISMGAGTEGGTVTIPVISIGYSNGEALREAIQSQTGTVEFLSSILPDRDSDFDAGIITHEYGHGISYRLTGPRTQNCLSGDEQQGEGWSDFFGLMLTMTDDVCEVPRGIGTYASFQDTTGPGIRRYRYTPDMSINPFTYADVADETNSAPHGVGSIWATMLWDMTCKLTDRYGYDPEVYSRGGGNGLALQLVIDGEKMQGCNPQFVKSRDGILAADAAMVAADPDYLTNKCIIWNSFARRGVGEGASAGTTGRYDQTPSFAVPAECSNFTIAVTSSPGGTLSQVGAVNLAAAAYEDVLTFDIVPDSGYELVSVEGCEGSVVGNQFVTKPIVRECSIHAEFVAGETFTVTATVDGTGGTISPPSQEVGAGDTASFTVTPDSGYHVDTITGDTCTVTGTAPDYTSSAINEDCAVTVTFAADGAQGKIVISQIYGGGGNTNAPFTHDFVELFNSGETAVDIGGWSIQYTSATGSSWNSQKTIIPAGTIIQPSKYFLIKEAGGANGAALPTPDLDVTSGAINMSGTAGKLALVKNSTGLTGNCPLPNADIADLVGFGTTADCREGGATTAFNAPAPSNTTGIFRDDGGCVDTDVNSDDFASATTPVSPGTPAPRNSASPAHTCSAGPVTHTVTPSVGTGNGQISPNVPQTVDDGDTTSFTLTADAGWHIDGVGGTCGGILVSDVFFTDEITEDCTVIANFAADPAVTFTVTPSVTGNGTITPDTPQTVDEGDTTGFTLAAAASHHIVNVTGTCPAGSLTGAGTASGSYTTGAIVADCTVVANFAQDTVTTVCGTGQSVEVAATAGPTGQTGYPTLKAAFDAINAGTHQGAIAVSICGDTTETASASLNASGTGDSSYTAVSVQPYGGAVRTISGAIPAGTALINLNGADNVTIDGLNDSGNALVLSNTTASGTAGTSTIRFIEGATGNTVTRTSIQGSATGAVGTATGVVLFSTSTVAGGNSNNLVSDNDIGPAGASLPTKGVMALGTGANANVDNVIDGNRIHDFFNATAGVSGISIQGNNNNWTISNNRIYQTAARTFTGTGLRYAGITITSSGNRFTVDGNVIGFGAEDGTGTTTISGSTNQFRGLDISDVSTTVATLVQNNVISGINQTTTANSTQIPSSSFIGIALGTTFNGLFNATGNAIGSLDGSSTITLNASSTTASTSAVIGILGYADQPATLSNNTIGAITIQGSGTGNGFRGFYLFPLASSTSTITDNIIGGPTAAGAITNTQTGLYPMYGVFVADGATVAQGNVVQNFSGKSTFVVGTHGIAMLGYSFTSSLTSPATHVSQNVVRNLTNVGGSAGGQIVGFFSNVKPAGNVFEKNVVDSLVGTSTATYQTIGFAPQGTNVGTFQNNIVRLGMDANGNSLTNVQLIAGLGDLAGVNSYYHNSVFIGGSGVTTGANSYAFYSTLTGSTRNIQDNIFWNARGNAAAGGAAHLAIRLGGTAPNPAGLTSNHNILLASGTDGATGVFNGGIVSSLAAWQVATGQDANSLAVDPQFVAPTGLTLDLHVQSTSPAIGAGTPIASVTDDIDGDPRSVTTPTIGADEWTAPTPTYTVGGTISGLSADGLSLTLNGGTAMSVASGATSFVFAEELEDGDTYAVAIDSQPTGLTCEIDAGTASGTIAGANVTNVAITCEPVPPPTYTVGGTISGLTANGLSLALNGGTPLSVASGATSFVFTEELEDGVSYTVTVASQPTGLTCTIDAGTGSGTIAGANVTSVVITCAENPTYAVGGTIDGLTTNGLSLTLNGGTALSVPSGSTTFLFDEELEDGETYTVAIASQPEDLECGIEAGTGSGTIVGADVTDVAITCEEAGETSPLELVISVAVDNGDPEQCGTGTSVTVPAYTKINVCYSLTNNSVETLSYHTLVDTQLGTLLNDASYSVAPGDTVQYNYTFVAAEGGTFTPVATWTAARTAGGVAGYVADPEATYNYTDISVTGTNLSIGDDAAVNITLPFDVTLFGVSNNRLRVGNNGAVLFNTTTGNIGYAPVALPATATTGNSQLGGAAFAPLWTDFNTTGSVRWQVLGSAPDRTAVIQWRRNHWNGNADGSGSSSDTGEVQLLLGENGSIVFNYVDVTFNATSPANNGGYASIGLQGGNTAGSPVAQYSYAEPSVVAGQAISWSWEEPLEFSAQGSYAFTVIPAPAPAITVTPEDGFEFTLEVGQSDSDDLTISNSGDAGSSLTWTLSEVPASARGVSTAVVTSRDALIARMGTDFYEEAFASVTSGPSAPLSFSGGAYSYEVASGGSGLYNDTGLISVNNSADQIVVTFTSPVTAVGGNFWATNANVQPTGTAIVATLDDGSTLNVPVSATSTFVGFISATPILSLTIDAPGTGNYWPTMDNLIVGSTVGGVNGCQDVADVPWLSITPTSGTLAAGASADAQVSVNASGLSEGNYTANICVASNDGANPLVSVPVSLTVTGGQPTEADLSVTIAASPTHAQIGQTVAYTIVASNIGPAGVVGAHLTDTPPVRLGNVMWVCTSAVGTSCPSPSEDEGALDTAIDLPSGASITFVMTGTVLSAANPDDDYTTFGNQASIALPKGSPLTDPVSGNNTAMANVTVVTASIFGDSFED